MKKLALSIALILLLSLTLVEPSTYVVYAQQSSHIDLESNITTTAINETTTAIDETTTAIDETTTAIDETIIEQVHNHLHASNETNGIILYGTSHDSSHKSYVYYSIMSDTPPSEGNKYHKINCRYPGCFYYDIEAHSFHYSGGYVQCTKCGYYYTSLDRSPFITK